MSMYPLSVFPNMKNPRLPCSTVFPYFREICKFSGFTCSYPENKRKVRSCKGTGRFVILPVPVEDSISCSREVPGSLQHLDEVKKLQSGYQVNGCMLPD